MRARALGTRDAPLVRTLLAANPVANVFVSSRIDAGLLWPGSPATLYGWPAAEPRHLLHAGSNLAPGCGERRSEVAARMSAAIDAALADVPPGGVLVVVTHGGSARAAIGSMLGLPSDHWGILGVLSNCAWCVLGETQFVATSSTASLTDVVTGPTEKFPDIPTPPDWRLVEYNAQTLPEEALSDDR